MADVNSVRLGGRVIGIKRWKTRDGDKPALTLSLEFGDQGEINVLVFGESAVKKVFDNVGDETLVVVHGRLSERGGIVAKNVVPIG